MYGLRRACELCAGTSTCHWRCWPTSGPGIRTWRLRHRKRPQRVVLSRLEPLRQAVEPRESSLYLLQRAIRRSDSPAHTLQLLRVRCEGGNLRRAEKRLQLGCDLRREAVGR